MIYITKEKHDDGVTVISFEDGLWRVGYGSNIEKAYEHLKLDPSPANIVHICKTKEEFNNLKQTHPELFI